jgi:hypothetical protein
MPWMDGFMNNRGSVVACPFNHCLFSKQSLFVCIKDICTMDVIPFFIFTMLILIILYPFFLIYSSISFYL